MYHLNTGNFNKIYIFINKKDQNERYCGVFKFPDELEKDAQYYVHNKHFLMDSDHTSYDGYVNPQYYRTKPDKEYNTKISIAELFLNEFRDPQQNNVLLTKDENKEWLDANGIGYNAPGRRIGDGVPQVMNNAYAQLRIIFNKVGITETTFARDIIKAGMNKVRTVNERNKYIDERISREFLYVCRKAEYERVFLEFSLIQKLTFNNKINTSETIMNINKAFFKYLDERRYYTNCRDTAYCFNKYLKNVFTNEKLNYCLESLRGFQLVAVLDWKTY